MSLVVRHRSFFGSLAGLLRRYNSASSHIVTGTAGGDLPEQTGHAGEYLKTDGSDADWAAAGGSLPARETVVATTASLASLAEEASTVAMDPVYRLTKVQADRACRVRLYVDTTARTNDASRGIGHDPDRNLNHGVLLDIVFGSVLSYNLSPAMVGYCDTGAIPYRIQNRSGSSSTVAVTFTFQQQEA